MCKRALTPLNHGAFRRAGGRVPHTLCARAPTALAPPVQDVVEFKFPLFMPGMARLEHWMGGERRVFVLKDSDTGRPHLAGYTQPD